MSHITVNNRFVACSNLTFPFACVVDYDQARDESSCWWYWFFLCDEHSPFSVSDAQASNVNGDGFSTEGLLFGLSGATVEIVDMGVDFYCTGLLRSYI
jgi:hypothetical protein